VRLLTADGSGVYPKAPVLFLILRQARRCDFFVHGFTELLGRMTERRQARTAKVTIKCGECSRLEQREEIALNSL
jgi:hypothetical protein